MPMKRDIKFYRRDKSVSLRRHRRYHKRNGKFKVHYDRYWEYAYIYFPFRGKDRRVKEKAQMIEYLKTGNDEVFYPIKNGDFYWN